MLNIGITHLDLLAHGLTPSGPIPTAFDPDGVYPYPSYCETANRPVLRRYRAVILENDLLRAVVLPELGGKLYSLINKTTGREALFQEPVLRPVRILPRMAFISGGLEVSFPISHTPVQIEQVHCETREYAQRVYCHCGERELRFGMQWTVEFSLGEGEGFLTQRLRFRNPSNQTHSWMSWSNAAVAARPDTLLDFPSGPVLCHGDVIREIDWERQGPKTQADITRMTGYFWRQPDVNAFGVFTPSLGTGLYHIASRAIAPGIKLWSYGVGGHQRWSNASTLSRECYLEIQAGPIIDQSIKHQLAPGGEGWSQEFWIPAAEPLDIRRLECPAPELIPISEIPLFSWPPRPSVAPWRKLSTGDLASAATLAEAPWDDNWAPSGMDDLGAALESLFHAATGDTRSFWAFQLGAWHAGRDHVDCALHWLVRSDDDRARALAGRLQRICLQDSAQAAETFRSIRSEPFALHPQVVLERDLALAQLGPATWEERQSWLDRTAALDDEMLAERRAQLSFDQGRPDDALAILQVTPFQLLHQRYARSDLFRQISGLQVPVPDSLGEDDLAIWGAYREHEPS